METNNETVVPEHYNANQLVTYKIINGDSVTFPTIKVNELEYTLERARTKENQLAELRLQVSSLEEKLVEWIDNDSSAVDIVAEICEIFEFTPTREVEFEASVRITGTVDVPLAEIANFDIQDVDLNIDVSSWSHNIDVDTEMEYLNTV